MKNYIPFLFALFFFNLSWSRPPQLSKKATISILTCGPGSELYAKFGHSALRVNDPVNGIDIVYNYGVFDFNQPNFYLNFAKGRLNYMLVRHRSNDFINQYRQEDRSVTEQILQLNTADQNKILRFLEHNAKPENRTYSYHFFFNNCATKIIDVLSNANSSIVFEKEFIDNNQSFRRLIDTNLHENSWGSLGIHIALGSKIDRIATDYEHRFLPEYIALQLIHSSIDGSPLVQQTNILVEESKSKQPTVDLSSPLAVFSLILIITILILIRSKNIRFWKWSLIAISSLIGIGILYLWVMTNHDMTQNNFNILWANPLALLLFASKKLKSQVVHYLYIILILGLVLIPLIALIGIQSFNISLYPLIMTLLIIYINSYKKIKSV